jgi:transposase-like protein
MDLLTFFERFPDEDACEAHIISVRWPHGYVCPHCASTKAWYMRARRTFECADCHRQQSITAGTLFHKTRVPLQEWFLAIHLLATSKKGISALALQRQLPQHDENTIRLMLAKLQRAMAERDALYQLAGVVEVDEAFFGGRRAGGKRGRGSENKQKVLVAVSVDGDDQPQKVKFAVLEALDRQALSEALSQRVEPGATVVTDGYVGYSALQAQGYDHAAFKMQKPSDNQAYLPWVHIVISNAKRFILGTHHSVRHLQRYLAEFAWRFNRRFTNLFERLLISSLACKPA